MVGSASRGFRHQVERLENLVDKIQYKPGWRFEVGERMESNIIVVGICLTTVEQEPKKRKTQEYERAQWARGEFDVYQWSTRDAERGVLRNADREPRTLVWREVPFPVWALPDLTDEIIVGQIWEMVIAIETHEIKEFFRFDGLCLQEPHPESPRELAFDGAFDRSDIVYSFMTRKEVR